MIDYGAPCSLLYCVQLEQTMRKWPSWSFGSGGKDQQLLNQLV